MTVKTYTTEKMGIEAHSQLVKKERKSNNVWNKLQRNKTAMIGLVIVVFMIVLAVFAPLLATHDPNAIKPSETYLGLGENGHLFGTDEFGRDLFSRVVYGARISLIAAIGGTIVGGVIGILLGLISGYAGGVVDAVIMRIMDGMLAFPFVLLAIILMTILGSGLQNVILADAADGHHGDVHCGCDGSDGFSGDGRGIGLGAGDKGGAHAQIVGASRLSPQGLLHRVGGDADQLVWP